MDPSQLIDKQIADFSDWRGELLKKLRNLIHDADPEITEKWKWSTPVFTHNGMVLALGVMKDHVKINFFQGASLSDQHKLFNAGLEAKKTRAIDIFGGSEIDEKKLASLIKEAVAYNLK